MNFGAERKRSPLVNMTPLIDALFLLLIFFMVSSTFRDLVGDAGRREAKRIEKGLVPLEAIAGVAPLLGLLGTVIGMIRVFRVIALLGVGNANALSGGISQALITTAVGLSVAIPALAAYHFFASRATEIVSDMEHHASQLIRKLRGIQSQEMADGTGAVR